MRPLKCQVTEGSNTWSSSCVFFTDVGKRVGAVCGFDKEVKVRSSISHLIFDLPTCLCGAFISVEALEGADDSCFMLFLEVSLMRAPLLSINFRPIWSSD